MKTWQSILAHIGISALQVAVSVPYFSPGAYGTGNSATDALANGGVQLGGQLLLGLLQGLVAKQNSGTAPDGSNLIQGIDGTYKSGK